MNTAPKRPACAVDPYPGRGISDRGTDVVNVPFSEPYAVCGDTTNYKCHIARQPVIAMVPSGLDDHA